MSNVDLLQRLYPTRVKSLQQTLEDTPQTVRPTVTLADAENRQISRYFVQMVTDTPYIVEVDKTQFERFKRNPRFNTFELMWSIVGKKESVRKSNNVVIYGVEDINREKVITADLTMPGIRLYIQDYTEFWFSEAI